MSTASSGIAILGVILGAVGSVLYLINHAYISLVKHWKPSIYYAGNLIAALLLVVSSLIIASYQAVWINGFWALVSAALLVNIAVHKIPLSASVFYAGLGIMAIWALTVGIFNGFFSEAFYSCLGWSSTYVFCLSYLLFCSKKLSHGYYLAFNIYASCALLPVLWLQQNWPVYGLELCWALISAYGLCRRIEQVHLID